jgi:hypothetical protein
VSLICDRNRCGQEGTEVFIELAGLRKVTILCDRHQLNTAVRDAWEMGEAAPLPVPRRRNRPGGAQDGFTGMSPEKFEAQIVDE